MQLPIVAPAPLVTRHAAAFQDLFENRCQFQHFQQYLTALMVLPNKSLSNIARCVLDSADKTNLARFFSEAPWKEVEVNDRRITYLLTQTVPQRRPAAASALLLDDTLCEHVGSLFEYVDRHYNHSDATFPLAHNPVTSHYVSGPVRFPIDLRLYRRYEEVTRWEEFVRKHFPAQVLPMTKQERAKLHKVVDPVLLADPAFQALHVQFHTKIDLAIELVRKAVERSLPFSVVLFDSWYLAEELVRVLAELHKDWVSILKRNRNLETNSFVLRNDAGEPIPFVGPHVKVEDLVPHIPASAYRSVTVGEQTYWCFTLTVRLASLGKVRLVISFANAGLTGTYVALVTNRLDWSAKQIIARYMLRWPVETFYQDGKSYLGLNEYRMRSAEAIKKHWCLVFVAYSFLHLACLPPPLTKVSAPVQTIGAACRQQTQALIEAMILYAHDQLQRGQHVKDVFARLFAKQRLVAT
jgi:SRSO17 transposase